VGSAVKVENDSGYDSDLLLLSKNMVGVSREGYHRDQHGYTTTNAAKFIAAIAPNIF